MINPIIKKNIWSELTPGRIIIMPVIIAGIFSLIYVQSDDWAHFLHLCQNWSYILIGIFLFLGGNLVVAEGLATEINSRTWVNLRMTSLSARELTFGKLFGENIFIWYGTFLSVIPYLFSSYLSETQDFSSSIKYLIMTLLAGIFSHSVTMLLCFIGIRRNASTWNKVNSIVFAVLGIIVAGSVLYYISQLRTFEQPYIRWNYIKIKYEDLSIITFFIFALWSVFGVYRNMRSYLHLRNGLVAWTLFLITIMAYFGGYATFIVALDKYEITYLQLLISLMLGYLITLVLAFSEMKNIKEKNQLKQYLSFRRLDKYTETKNKSYYRAGISLWGYTAYFSLFLVVVLLLYIQIDKLSFLRGETYITFPLSVLFFLLRDLCILVMIYSIPKIKKAGLVSLMILLFLYVLLPSIVSFISPSMQQSGVNFLVGLSHFFAHESLFYPMPFGLKDSWGTLPSLFQFLIALVIFSSRWNKLK